MHYFKGAREHRPPGGSVVCCLQNVKCENNLKLCQSIVPLHTLRVVLNGKTITEQCYSVLTHVSTIDASVFILNELIG